MKGSLRNALAVVVFGAFFACFFILLQRRTTVLWVAGMALVSIAPSMIGIAVHALVFLVAYLLLTLFVGITALLKQIGREIPIC